jgi:hypothetical protein
MAERALVVRPRQPAPRNSPDVLATRMRGTALEKFAEPLEDLTAC